MLEHPAITRTLLTGYPEPERKTKICYSDEFNRPVFEGDDIFVHEGLIFKIEGLDDDAIEVLEAIGADYKIAKK